MSSIAFHFVQPDIIPAKPEDEKIHINSKEQKKTSSSAIEAIDDSTTFTETTSSSSSSTSTEISSSSSTSMDPSSTETTSESANTNLVVFYNRIPKTGSENMAFIIKELSKQNDFKQKRFARNDRGPLTEAEANKLENVMCTCEEPTIFDEHIHFLPTEPCQNTISWITMVRDPVEMFISRYFYARRGSKNSGKNMFESFKKSGKISKDLTIDEWKEKDLSNCILSGDPECAFVEGTKNDLPVAYLCGQDDYCKIVEDRRALRQAKKNMEKSYAVVGVLEELNTTLALLEHELPSFFGGASDLYFNQLKEPHRNRGGANRKTLVTQEARDELESRLSMEREFYVWVTERLHKQFEELSGR